MAVSYIPKQGRNVILISTRHREAEVTEGPKKKPERIADYNRCKGGVDNLDKIVDTYSCRRRTNWWPEVLFFNMVDITSCSAYVSLTAVDPSWNQAKLLRRRIFLEELGNSLVSAAILRRESTSLTHQFLLHWREGFSLVQLSLQTQSHRHQQLRSEVGNLQVVHRTEKRTVSTCICCGSHTCKEHQVICCKSCWKD
ncbi:hypothetical protein QTP70_004958 [Hemibagrus guttatus]|uniref:PiggyBac transposable element-derived protein domain-containing protein n=1 Tax=Hemibagrus guttatus TaxID=175788 RepID=A0AAE0QFI7_9TELE|nr:hypothetical protein QTP70_004958 [Hemibagrus guttatus]